MKIKDIEQFTIPVAPSAYEAGGPPIEGTTVEELIRALSRLPAKGIVQSPWHTADLVVWLTKPDIDADEALGEAEQLFISLTNGYI